MAWAHEIYYAEISTGIYYTNNFTNPGVQPVWTKINTGLGDLNCEEFHLDPFHQQDRQYVLTTILGGDNKLYKREYGGSWVAICTPASLATLFGYSPCKIKSFWPDTTIDGRLWIACNVNGYGDTSAYSDDYGATWHTRLAYWNRDPAIAIIRTVGDAVYIRDHGGVGDYPYVEYSGDKGATWNYIATDLVAWSVTGQLNPLELDRLYLFDFITPQLEYFKIGAGLAGLHNGLYSIRSDALWFHPTDPLHQRIVNASNQSLYATIDGWANITTPGACDYKIISIADYGGFDPDCMLVGIDPTDDFPIGALYGESDITVDNISGTNYGTPPYIDAIPVSSTPCRCGIQGVYLGKGKVYTNAVAMYGYSDTGLDRGEPMAGDRSAFDAKNYPLRHTDDIDDNGIHWTEAELKSWNLGDFGSDSADDGYVLTADGVGGANWEAPTGGGGGGGGGTEYKMTVLTFLGDLTISDNPLRLSNELTTTQTIVEVYLTIGSAPTGDDVVVDIHKNGTTIFTNQAHRPVIAAGTNSGTTTTIDVPSWADGDYLTAHVDNIGSTIPGSDLVVHVVTTGPGGGASTLDDLTDVNVPSPGDNDVLAWDAGAGEWVNVPASAGSGGLEGIFSVKDPTYGAVGDGTTDDTTAIQAAEAAAHATGGVLYFPPGSYSCTDIPMHRNVTIRGTNGATWIIARAGTSSLFYYDDSEFNVYGAIEDISIDGNHIADNGINFEGGIWMTMRRVLVMNCTVGLKLWGILESQLYDCVVLANGIGISLNHFDTFSGHMDANLIHLNNCYIQYNTSWGVYCINGDQLVLDGSDWEQNGTHGNSSTGGIYFKPLTSDRGLVINNCWSELNEGKGEIVIDTPTTVTGYNVIENYISYPVAGHCSYGIAVASGNKVYCKNVTVTDAAVSGFEVDAGATVYLDDCIGTISGAGTFILGRDASGITYTPAVVADWNGGVDPGNADGAFDQLADRVKTLEGDGVGGQYRQFLYEVSGGTFTFLTDVIGNPLEGLQDLE